MNKQNTAEKLAEENIRLSPFIVRKYLRPPEAQIEEYVAIGNVGLCKAAKNFDPNRGIKFSTFAARCIMGELAREYRRSNRKKRTAPAQSISLDMKAYRDTPLHELIPSTDIDIDQSIDDHFAADKLHTALNKLPARDKHILCVLYGVGVHQIMTQSQLAQVLGISQAQVSRRAKQAIEKLRNIIKVSPYST